MRNLLSANFARLWRDKVFWLCLAALLAFTLFNVIMGGQAALSDPEYAEYYTLDRYYFFYASVIGVFCAVFTSLFLGTEYSDGTIRNKFVVGHTHAKIYLSNLIVSFAASLVALAGCLIAGLAGIPVLGLWQIGVVELLTYVLLSVLFLAAFAAIFTFVGMMFSNKAISAVISILLCFGMLFASAMIVGGLSESETLNGNIIMTEEGGMQMINDDTPNPSYIKEPLRSVYEVVLDIIPAGQSVQVAAREVADPLRMAACSVILSAVVTAGGIALFRKKNLK